MKQLLTTIVALVLVGCGESRPPDISIYEAAFNGNIEAVKQHLAAGADVNAKEISVSEWTALHRATQSGHQEIVELLIKQGADLNTMGIGGTPLHTTLMFNKNNPINIAELLISNGADVNRKDEKGRTPFALCG